MRRCKLKSCRKPLPPMKDCTTVYQEKGLCDEKCSRTFQAGKRAEYAERKRQKEQAKPRTARVSAKPKKRKPRAGDDRAYLQWVKTLPCVLCQQQADDAHHLIGLGFGGMGMTAPDLLTIPVCRDDHRKIHEMPELWEEQYKWLAETINRAAKEGIL